MSVFYSIEGTVPYGGWSRFTLSTYRNIPTVNLCCESIGMLEARLNPSQMISLGEEMIKLGKAMKNK